MTGILGQIMLKKRLWFHTRRLVTVWCEGKMSYRNIRLETDTSLSSLLAHWNPLTCNEHRYPPKSTISDFKIKTNFSDRKYHWTKQINKTFYKLFYGETIRHSRDCNWRENYNTALEISTHGNTQLERK